MPHVERGLALSVVRHRVVRWTALYGWEARDGGGQWVELSGERDGGALLNAADRYQREGYIAPGQPYALRVTLNASLVEEADGR